MFYRSKITDCPDGLSESWVNVTFPRKIVLPQRDQTVSLNLYGELSISEFYCSVQLENRIGELVASRRIKIRKMDRCSCVLHCLCVCVGDTRGTDCRPISPELYHAAGFRGPVPPATHGIFSDTKVDVMLFVVSLMFLLLFMGLLKWIIGLRSPAVGRWGLDSLLECRRMSEYLERELKCKCVVTDEHGAPVHPETRKKTVRICSRKTEFFLNATFFLIFPFAVCCYRFKKLFRISRRRDSDKSEISSTNDKTERPETICVSTYGDNRDSQMEAEDTKYVIDELKKSEEVLRNHSRSGRNRCAKQCRSHH
ncbi:uncharacterized protein LOC109854151 [Pseudomyrmex gracilis]|uniref:uncharacterized protein LOC109854151 n=1 Tax=Pseudomyrmex gracilis TaxID=219809 RepID=UPI000995B228|nr:uncharacterized protein LOC109854151 [Pseudomyrmex gracilis]